MIDLRHPLAVLSTHMPRQEIEVSLAGVIARKVKAGRKVEDIDLFGPMVQVSGGGISNAGRPRFPMRLMVSLLYLEHTYNLSDAERVVAWSENVYLGCTRFQRRFVKVFFGTGGARWDSAGIFRRSSSSRRSISL